MFKRLLSIALAFVMILPLWVLREGEVGEVFVAEASTAPTEPQFVDNATVDPTTIPAVFNADATARPTVNMGATTGVSDWAYAGFHMLHNAARASAYDSINTLDFNVISMNNRNATGNRSAFAAFLMNIGISGNSNNNVPGVLEFTTYRRPVTGVVYIPTSTNAENNRNRIKQAVQAQGGIAASIFYEAGRMHASRTASTGTMLGDNHDIFYPANTGLPNRTVVIIGWDDNFTGYFAPRNEYRVGEGPHDNLTLPAAPGAFLVFDNQINGLYWVPYSSAISNPFYIEGFFDNGQAAVSGPNMDDPGRAGVYSDFFPITQRSFAFPNSVGQNDDYPEAEFPDGVPNHGRNWKNPLAHTYQPSTAANGMPVTGTVPGVPGSNTVSFANEFTINGTGPQAATGLHAISVFLTGRNNSVRAYLVNDFRVPADLARPENRTLILEDVNRANPGYYTFPINRNTVLSTDGVTASTGIRIESERTFAIVVEVTYDEPLAPNGFGIPTTTGGTQGLVLRPVSGGAAETAWTRIGSPVAIKAHAERDIEFPLTRVEIRDDRNRAVNADNTLSLPAGQSVRVGPTVIPFNAHNILPTTMVSPQGHTGDTSNMDTVLDLTGVDNNPVRWSGFRWEAFLPWFPRHTTGDGNGLLILDKDADDNPTTNDDDEFTVTPTGPQWLVWNTNWNMFLERNFSDLVYRGEIANRTGAQRSQGFDPTTDAINAGRANVVGYVEPAISMQNAASPNASVVASRATEHFYDDDGALRPESERQVRVRVSVRTGIRNPNTGEFENHGAGIDGGHHTTAQTHGPTGPNYLISGTIRSSNHTPGSNPTNADATFILEASPVAELRMNRTTTAMGAGASAQFNVSQWDAEGRAVTPPAPVRWSVMPTAEVGAAPFNPPFDPLDPHNPNGPPATIDDTGRVTGLRDGSFFVVAESGAGRATARVEVNRVAATGVTVNRRRQTLSVGSTITLTGNPRPARASNRRVTFESSDPGVVRVVNAGNAGDSDTSTNGIIQAMGVGTATITVRLVGTAFEATSTITVQADPSNSIRSGRTANFNVLGATARDNVIWSFEPPDVGDPQDVTLGTVTAPSATVLVERHHVSETGGLVTGEPDPRRILSGEVPNNRGNRYRVRADAPTVNRTIARLVGRIEVDGVVVREQSFSIAPVIAISRITIHDFPAGTDPATITASTPRARRVNLGVDVPGSGFTAGNQSHTLRAIINRPDGATNLGFSWEHRLPRNVTDPMLAISTDPASPLNHFEANEFDENVTITALRAGSTRLTGTNRNSRRRVTLSVRIMPNPAREQIIPRGIASEDPAISSVLNVRSTRGASIRPRFARGVNREVTYELFDPIPPEGGGAILNPADDPTSNGVVQIDARRGRITAIGPAGSSTIIRIWGSGSNPGRTNFHDVRINVT